jgi:hypothetical protein
MGDVTDVSVAEPEFIDHESYAATVVNICTLLVSHVEDNMVLGFSVEVLFGAPSGDFGSSEHNQASCLEER